MVLGDFGLYAAACGCQVFLFEVQPAMADLIQTSIVINNFSLSRTHLIQKAVNDLPSNSQLTFSLQGGGTKTASNGSLQVSTIRLDDVKWPPKSSIFLLKIDVEGFELNVLRSAQKLFEQQRVRHLIFEYTAWWTERAPQRDLLPYVEKTLKSKLLYALHRTDAMVYGPLNRSAIDEFFIGHLNRRLQTDIYAVFDQSDINSSLKAQPYSARESLA